MITNKIHYCWFGGNEKPQSVVKCIDSWKKFFPGFEIIEWNESNFDVRFCTYTSEAYDKKKWAFVSDVARLKVVYDHGGVYFDTDVEVIKSFDDILSQAFFVGMESQGRINSGLGFGAEKGSPVVKAMLDYYNDLHFVLPDGRINPMVCPDANTQALLGMGLVFSPGIIRFQGGSIFPEEYFSPKSVSDGVLRITKNTYSIHHYQNTWMTPWQRAVKKLRRHKYLSSLYHFVKKLF